MTRLGAEPPYQSPELSSRTVRTMAPPSPNERSKAADAELICRCAADGVEAGEAFMVVWNRDRDLVREELEAGGLDAATAEERVGAVFAAALSCGVAEVGDLSLHARLIGAATEVAGSNRLSRVDDGVIAHPTEAATTGRGSASI